VARRKQDEYLLELEKLKRKFADDPAGLKAAQVALKEVMLP
jgi:hypothetical protein